MTAVSVLVPFRPDGGHRDAAWAWLRQWWAATHPDWQVIAGACPDGPWIKAAAVADALSRADGGLLVIADADVLCDGIGLAVEACRRGAPWAMPHGKVYRLNPSATDTVLAGGRPDAIDTTQQPYIGVGGGGIVVLPRATYDQVPLDPRFAGWGGEDESWALALNTVVGMRWRGTAPLYHLWHEPQPRLNRHVGSAGSRALQVRYQYASQDGPTAMRALLDEIRTPVTT